MRREYGSSTIYTGADVKKFTRRKRKKLALQVSKALAQHPYMMRQLKINDVHASIKEGNATVVFSKGRKTPAAFAHLIPAKNEYGEYEEEAVEVGALTTLAEPGNGHGTRAIIATIIEARRRGKKRIKALVSTENPRGNKAMEELAGKPDHVRPSNYVKGPDGQPVQMNVYELTHVGGQTI